MTLEERIEQERRAAMKAGMGLSPEIDDSSPVLSARDILEGIDLSRNEGLKLIFSLLGESDVSSRAPTKTATREVSTLFHAPHFGRGELEAASPQDSHQPGLASEQAGAVEAMIDWVRTRYVDDSA